MDFKVTSEPIENRQLAIKIEVAKARVDAELRKAASKLAGKYKLPGFRQGKAPYHIVVQQMGLANVYSEFTEELGQEAFAKALEETGIKPYAQSQLQDIQLEPLVYHLIVPLEPEITLGDYRAMRIEETAPEVTEEAVEAKLADYQKQFSSRRTMERPSEFGDMLTIDVKAVIAAEEEGGEPIIVLEETDWDVTPDLENPMEPAGFDEALIGINPGETKEFILSWPADSRSIYAGKSAAYTVTVKSIESYGEPALDDELAKLVGPEFETLDDLRKNVRESLETEGKAGAVSAYTTRVLDTLVEMSILNYPPAVIEDQIDGMLNDTHNRIRQMGIEEGLNALLSSTKQTVEQYREQLRPEAERIARRNLVLSQVIQAENIHLHKEEVDARIRQMVGVTEGEAIPEGAESLVEMLSSGAGLNMVSSELLTGKAIAFLLAMARGEEAPADPFHHEHEIAAVEMSSEGTGTEKAAE